MTEIITIDTEVLDAILVGRVEPQIYAFTTQTIPNYLKVGDTYRPLEVRLNEWRKYFPNLEKKFETIAKVDDDTFFRDFAVHYFLENDKQKTRLTRDTLSNIPYFSNEFFKNASENDIKDAIEDIKKVYENNQAKYQYYKFDESHIPITYTFERVETFEPRPNQKETINKFKDAIAKGRNNLLMYAVMRFGKSFTSMCCAYEMKAKFVMVVSAKADVKSEWKKTVESHIKFEGYSFLDSSSLLKTETIISDTIALNKKIVLFLTLQDLQGDEIKSKHKEIFENQIDLLLIDETHFGARAIEYGKVLKNKILEQEEKVLNTQNSKETTLDELDSTIKILNAKVRIHLSGTPYRILMNSEFTNDDIIAFYQFSDIAQDQEKWDNENLNKDETKEWDNPYYGFPKMIRFAFNPNKSSKKRLEDLKNSGFTYAFSQLFRPLSIVKDKENNLHKKFQYEQEIKDLLQVIDGSQNDDNLLSFLDYDKIKDGKMCRHIVCVLPYRASCDALEELIKTSKFKNLNLYEIINISGVDSDKIYKDTHSVVNKIKEYESQNKKTVTLTVNKMLTGSTVPQWDTMLYFKDTSSPQEYDQAIFRLQNQYIKTYKEPNGDVVKYNMKPQTLLVDFNPNRMFQIQEQKSQIYNVNTESNGNSKLEDRIRQELQISPIIVINSNKIVEITPTDILNEVRKYSSSRSVLDEATTIAIDLDLLKYEAIKAEIEKQAKLGSKQGLQIEAVSGDGEDLDIENENIDENSQNKQKSKDTKKDDTIDYKGQFAMYYARILFFAFLTDSKVKSLEEIIDEIEKSNDNQRIAKNLNLSLSILKLFQKHINPFVLSELDYKIHNINSLANDTTLTPIQRASNAMKKFSRLGDSEIVTPELVTDMIMDILPSKNINDTTKFLDIASKQGEFVYAVYKKYGKEKANNFYSIPTSKTAYEFTRKVYALLELDINHIGQKYTSYNLIGENKMTIANNQLSINGDKLDFNIVVGNPPYQESDGGAGASAKPIYNEFVGVSKELIPTNIALIMPTRWYAGGKGLDEFRDQMLSDTQVSQLHDFLKPEVIFPEINLRGGICYLLWDKEHNNNLTQVFTYKNDLKPKLDSRKLRTEDSDIFIRHGIAIEILKKINSHQKFKSFEKHISSRRPFNIDANIVKNEKFRNSKKGLKNSVLCYGKGKQVGYLERDEISKNIDWIDKYKVFTPRANNIGTELNDDNLNTFIGNPNTICTESYIVVGVNLNLDETSASNLCKYFTTKFARFQHSVGKASQDATSKTYKFVPLQDFTVISDIDWNISIGEIDKQLYKKYGLTKEEIDFIETMIKPMD